MEISAAAVGLQGAEWTGGTQEILWSESLRSKLRRLHHWKEREHECLDDDAPLFVSRLGRCLSLRQVGYGFTVWQNRAGFERRVYTHPARMTWSRRSRVCGADARVSLSPLACGTLSKCR